MTPIDCLLFALNHVGKGEKVCKCKINSMTSVRVVHDNTRQTIVLLVSPDSPVHLSHAVRK